MTARRKETDSLGGVEVPVDKLWGAQIQRYLDPKKMVSPYVASGNAASAAH
jgi:fumarate hydratase class II